MPNGNPVSGKKLPSNDMSKRNRKSISERRCSTCSRPNELKRRPCGTCLTPGMHPGTWHPTTLERPMTTVHLNERCANLVAKETCACVYVCVCALDRSIAPLVSERDTLRDLFAHLTPGDDTSFPSCPSVPTLTCTCIYGGHTQGASAFKKKTTKKTKHPLIWLVICAVELY